MRAFLCLIVLLCLIHPVFAQGVHWQADVPLLDCDGTPCVEVKLSDGVARFGIDTGNAASVLDTKRATDLGLKPSAPPKPGTPAGMFRSSVSLSLGDVSLQNLSIVVMDLSDPIAQKQMPHVAGTLAYPAFKDRILQFDFIAHRMRVSAPLESSATCPEPCDSFTLIKFGEHGPPIVVANGFMINGHPVAAQIDTMFTGSMLIYSAAIEKVGLSIQAKSTTLRNFALTDGGVQMKQADSNSEKFHNLAFGPGKVYFPTQGVHEPDGLFEATVGLELFRNSVLMLDFHDRKISLQRNSRS